VAGGLLILALLLRFLPMQQLGTALSRVPLALWLLVLIGYLSAHLIGVLKWRLMINLAGARISHAQAARCYFAGLFSTLFLPSIVGGDVVRLGLAMRFARNRLGTLLGSLLDRMLDVAALASVVGLGALLVPGALNAEHRIVFRWIAVAAAAAIIVVTAVAVLIPARRLSYRMRRRVVRLRQAGRSTARQPGHVLLALTLAITVQTSFVLLTAVIARGCGLDMPLRVWLFAWPLAKLVALVPLTQGGIGVRELALAALLAPFGAAPALTVAVGLVWEAVILSGGLLAGLISFLLGGARLRRCRRLILRLCLKARLPGESGRPCRCSGYLRRVRRPGLARTKPCCCRRRKDIVCESRFPPRPASESRCAR